MFAGRSAHELQAVLDAQQFQIVLAQDAQETLALAKQERPDLIVLDVRLPGGGGIDACQALKSDDSTPFIPIMLVTAEGDRLPVVQGFAVGADDYVERPVDPLTLRGRVRALLRTKNLYELALQQAAQIQGQLAELATFNARLEAKLADQMDQLQRLSRLKRFVSAPVAERLLTAEDSWTASHRAEVTALFIDLRGFTSFAENAPPDAVMELLSEYHGAVGKALELEEGTLEHFAGDGIMAFFNDPVPQPDHTDRAIRSAIEIRTLTEVIGRKWRARGLPVGVGFGIARGAATLGYIGFAERLDYAVIGTVPNRAARLCGEAKPGQILIDAASAAAVQPFPTRAVGAISLKGMNGLTSAFEIQPPESNTLKELLLA